ncbi:hypothetical protein NDU88_002019 [Pleurodeles waltl]|uniref:Uncharacterized protein n=1 Tax=Pleurodeles waltl TaxID=8319 RepID=A0AAV7VBS6_PLEWA|nr:hypothetical protein NDU88_002019 [Pleurodeles waltl]
MFRALVGAQVILSQRHYFRMRPPCQYIPGCTPRPLHHFRGTGLLPSPDSCIFSRHCCNSPPGIDPVSAQLTVLLALSVVLLLSPLMPDGTPQDAPQLDQVPAEDQKGSPPYLNKERAESHVPGPLSHRQGPPCVATNPRPRGLHPAVTSLTTSLILQAQPTSLTSCGTAQPFSGNSAEHQWRTHFVSLSAVHFTAQLRPFRRPSRPLSSSLAVRLTYGPLRLTSPRHPPFCSRQPR